MFSYQRLKRTLLASCAACLLTGQALADDAVIDNSFHPYQAKLPSYPGLTSGMVINKENVAQFKDIIDPAFLRFIEEGWTTITVGDTTSFDLHSSYIDATRNSLGKVSLGEKVGEISGWHAGRPFPAGTQRRRPARGRKTGLELQIWLQLGRQRRHLSVLLEVPRHEYRGG